MSNHYHATMKFTHGEIKIEGTILFVLATINQQKDRDGLIETVKSSALLTEEAAAKNRREEPERSEAHLQGFADASSLQPRNNQYPTGSQEASDYDYGFHLSMQENS